MKPVVNYRYEHGNSHKAEIFAPKHIKRLGKILSIEGYRWISTRSYMENGERIAWRNTHERLRIRGENGQCIFDGVCWGYNGQGPRALAKILIESGIDVGIANFISKNAPRNHKKGCDWKITIGTNTKIEEIKFNKSEPLLLFKN